MLFGLGHLLRSFRTHKIDVFEWQKSDVEKKRLSNNPQWASLATQQDPLLFSGWDLAHAVVKADFLIPRNLTLPGLGFLLQMDGLLDFGSPSLRLLSGGANLLADFTQTSVSGRIGQGLSILFAQEKGYNFAGHLATDPAVAAYGSSSHHPKIADFLFETNVHERMILESKASFHQPHNDPSRIKTVLKKALAGQVDPWMRRIQPAASKGFVTYSCIRDAGNPEPSALIFVDPSEAEKRESLELPISWTRRQNYAAWLTAMGLGEPARYLRSREKRSTERIAFFVAELEERSYAFLGGGRLRPFLYDFPFAVGWAGIDVEALKAVSSALQGDEQSLLDYKGIAPERSVGEAANHWSVFPDGTFLGSLQDHPPFLRVRYFEL